MAEGADLESAMRDSLEELDGVFTYIAVTDEALGVAKDEMAAKPLVLYESDDVVALASEEIAIRAVLDREIDTHDPYEGVCCVAVGEQRITYDARGLAEPNAEAPRIGEGEGRQGDLRRARPLHAPDQLELRRLLYEEGITDVTVQNPGKHSIGVGILTRCKITFDGSLYLLRPHRRARDPDQRPRRLVGLREHDVRRRRGRRNAGSLTGAALRGGDLVVKGQVGARSGSTRRAGRSSSRAMPAR